MNADHRQVLLKMIDDVLSEASSIKEFWRRYHFYYADMPEDALSETDYGFFVEVNEALHHTDFESPADPCLHDPKKFMGWLREALSIYLDGKWEAYPSETIKKLDLKHFAKDSEIKIH